ncbi:MAG: Cys-tRNA(Pro) deacylase [Firmicutes bacterium]|nr:Cys-tRNA(Pro) deacylase [Bacillota bacterium]
MAKAKGDKNEKTNVMRLLDAAGTAYRAYFYDSSDGKIDGVSVAGKTGFPVEQVFKTLITVGAGGGLYVFVIPVAEELDLKKAAKAAGEKNIAMIPSRDLLKNTGYIHGGCSPVGMKKPYPTFIHESAILLDTMVCSAGKIGAQIELAPDDLLTLTKAQYADVTK